MYICVLANSNPPAPPAAALNAIGLANITEMFIISEVGEIASAYAAIAVSKPPSPRAARGRAAPLGTAAWRTAGCRRGPVHVPAGH